MSEKKFIPKKCSYVWCINNGLDCNIDNFIDYWHAGYINDTLPEYLGMSDKDYALYVVSEKSLPGIVEKYKEFCK